MAATPISNDKVLPRRLFLWFMFLTHSLFPHILLPSRPFLDPDSHLSASRDWHKYTPFGEHHPWNGNPSRPAIFCHIYPRSHTADSGCPCFAHCPYVFLSRFRYSTFPKDNLVSLVGWPPQDKVPPTGSFFVI